MKGNQKKPSSSLRTDYRHLCIDPIFELLGLKEPRSDCITVEDPSLKRIDSLSQISPLRIVVPYEAPHP